jgi:hypothetical protein
MLLVRNHADHQSAWPAEKTGEFLRACERHIETLKSAGKLKSAQPLVREGKMISATDGAWKESSYQEGQEVIVGYYHILANDIDDAVAIPRNNPEFAFSGSASLEVRPIKTKESETDFEYPR